MAKHRRADRAGLVGDHMTGRVSSSAKCLCPKREQGGWSSACPVHGNPAKDRKW